LAANAILSGADPYTVVRRSFGMGFLYPLPTALVTVPLAWLPPTVAGGVFVGISSAVLAYASTARAWWPLFIFLNASAIESIVMGHWSTLMAAALFSPSLTWLGVFKPNIGSATLAYRPSLRAMLVMFGIFVTSLAVMPSWPAHWLESMRATFRHFAPIQLAGGFLMLLAAMRWRRPEGRLLAALAVLPSSPIAYEALPVLAVAQTRFEMILLGLCTDAMFLLVDRLADTHDPIQYFSVARPAMLWLIYIPTVLLVLRRPNEGHVPPELEWVAARLPAWLRGFPGPAAQSQESR
jgi:hypothetical protein